MSAAAAHPASGHRRHSTEGDDLDETDECTSQGVPGSDRAAVVADDAQAHDEPAQAAPPGQRLDHRWHDDGRDHHGNDAEGRGHGLRGSRGQQTESDGGQQEDADDDEQVDRAGRHPVGHTGHR